jgi:hypothetical protein
MQKIPDRIIDFHTHLFPDRMFDAIWGFFSRGYGWDVIHKLYHRQCIEHLRVRGVHKIVFSNYAHREGIAERLNDWNLQVLDGNPELYCFAAYHPGDANALAYAEKVLNHPQVLGIKLHFLVQCFYPHDWRLFPLYEMVADRGKRLLLHIGTGPVGNEYVGLEHFKKLLLQYPDLPVNVAHMGACEYQGFMDLLDDYPRLYLDTSYAFFKDMQDKGGFNLGHQPLEDHKDRILYGSDFPNLILPRESEIETLLAYNLSPEFYANVFFNNGNNLISSIVESSKIK